MTITYTAEVATCKGLGCFWKLLFRWRGSIYKLLWPNLIVYSVVYFSLSGMYRFSLSEENKVFFEKIALHCQAYGDLIPIAFVLGFYVSIVIKRWWDQYICIPWPDNLAMFVSTLVHGQDDRGRLMRRTIIRYVNLCLVITLRMMSPRVKKRFPTMEHLVEAGFLQPNEKKIFEDLDQKTSHPKYWMPLVWAGGIITRARKEGRIKDDFSMKTLIDELNRFRGGCGGMLNYDWISIPLVYTQVVTLAVYTYFTATLMGNQFLDPSKGYPKHEIDLVVPLFTFLQFFFYMGWLKVAESLVNPFGEDDDDFELNWLVDRNLQVSYVIVDEMHQEHPEMVKDQYWDEVFPAELPYTAAAKQYQTGPPPGSTDNVEVSLEMAEFMPLETVIEDAQDEDDDLGDSVLDVNEDKGLRKETHPMKILTRQKSSTSSASSFSETRGGRKSSVLNMLTKIFRREESTHDLAESNMGSTTSLRSRRGLRSISRISSMSQSQAQSRTSIARINTFQDEMFHMSDVSLAGSAMTTGSQIQISVTQRGLNAQEESIGNPDLSAPPSREKNFRKISQDKSGDGDSVTVDISQLDNVSEGSGNSICTTYYHDNPDTAELTSPKRKQSDSQAYSLGKAKKSEGKESVPLSPTVSFDDANLIPDAAVTTSTTRIIVPSSPPVKQIFTPLSSTNASQTRTRKKPILDKYGSLSSHISSLSRSLQQGGDKDVLRPLLSKSPSFTTSNTSDIVSTSVSSPTVEMTKKFEPQIPSSSNMTTFPISTFTSVSSTMNETAVTTSVSMHSPIVPTTSVVMSSGIPTFTLTPAVSTPIFSIGPIEIPPADSANTVMLSPPPTNGVDIPGSKAEGETVASSPTISQYVPSAAIPVPCISPAHVPGASAMMENNFEMEASIIQSTRRTMHEFHELEPISEHGEMASDSPMNASTTELKLIQVDELMENIGPESTV